MQADTDKKIADLMFDFNRRFATLTADYELLLASVTRVGGGVGGHAVQAAVMNGGAAAAGNATTPAAVAVAAPGPEQLMQSLSHVAGMHLQRHSTTAFLSGEKRGAPVEEEAGAAGTTGDDDGKGQGGSKKKIRVEQC